MRFGLALPHYDFSFPDAGPVSFAAVAEVARDAERRGFDSVWISDHLFLSLERYGGSSELQGSVEPLTTLAALAAITDRVRLGTLVLSAGFRHPAIVAKMATAIDLASNGRFDLGLGAGWYEDEYEAFGYPFGSTGERFSMLEETLEVLGKLFSREPVDHDGRWFRLRGAQNQPEPTQDPRPPIWLGSKGGARSLGLVARHCDGWNTAWKWTPDAYAERVAQAWALCEQAGRDPATLRLSVGLYTLVGEDRRDLDARWERFRAWAPGWLDGVDLDGYAADTLTGTVDEVLERVAAFEALGVEELILSPAPLPFAVPDPSILDVLAEGVLGR
jgi:probable F420-dependent oxidoreductase